ncbi:hypothetical protein [Dactylosporangium matsuzakiense]|uniref:Uncharacterized protein n=1 Tax=Dactylosporangium matsuzakiense TaxID=53360 RepID=A0A9W6KTV0_9ACTN|nr:hypothetical protein [Dactylosporangium matsuzakiense]UWZ44597.1 hypothetical protein Dmats_45895 [Dactylosporangium matsuzakiense]GLL05364.1 hypothetical protein GCM10017581_071110 [Dactylosporangium matsuzakiense]
MIHQIFILIDHSGLILAVGGALYTASTTAAAITALLAPTPGRRRDARKVLALLLRRAAVDDQPTPRSTIGDEPTA